MDFETPKILKNEIAGFQKIFIKKMNQYLRSMPKVTATSTDRAFSSLDNYFYGYIWKDVIFHHDKLIERTKKLMRNNKPLAPLSQGVKKKAKTLSAGYKRQNEGTRGQYEFLTKDGVYILDSYLVERQNDTEDSLEIQDNLRNVLGTIIIKNSAWPKLKKGLTIMARSSKGPKGKLTKIKNYN